MREGWEIRKLGEVCDIFDRKRKPISKRDREPGPYPYYGASCIQDYISDYLFDGRYLLIGEDGAKWGPGEDTAYIAEGKFWVNNHAHIVKAKAGYLDDYLRYYIKHLDLNPIVAGAIIPKLTQEKLASLEVPIPSLPEQQRIVDILDREFAKIDALKANAEKSLHAAKDLFVSTLTKELKHKEGWKETKIGDFCEIIRGKRFVRADIVEKGVPCIHYGDIYTYYGMYATKAKGCVSPDLAKKLRFANKNDVIVVAAGENKMDIGVGVAWLGDEPAVVHDACFILRHSQNPMFLSFYFRSAEYHRYLKDEVNEGKICSFLTKPLAEAKISLPPLEEQEQIVHRLEIVSNNCNALQENYQKTLTLCDDLKQSLLRKAFNGEL